MKDELSNRKSGIQNQRYFTLVDDLKSDASAKPWINLRRRRDNQAHSAPTRFPHDVAHQPGWDLDVLEGTADHELSRMEDERLSQRPHDSMLEASHVARFRLIADIEALERLSLEHEELISEPDIKG